MKPLTAAILFFTVLLLFVGFLVFKSKTATKDTAPEFPEELLKTLPYAGWGNIDKKNSENSGISIFKPELSQPGINLYCSESRSEAYLMGLDGQIHHTWRWDGANKQDLLTHVELAPNGDLLILIWETLIARLDWNSNVKWIYLGRFHHDIAIAESGDIYTLAWKPGIIDDTRRKIPYLEDLLVILSPDGKLQRQVPLMEIIRNKVHDWSLNNAFEWIRDSQIDSSKSKKPRIRQDTSADLLHNNSVEILNRSIPGFGSKGDVLLSFRSLNLIGVIDLQELKLKWDWGPGEIERQHHPTLLKNGNILLFDNGEYRKYSRVIELDPESRKIVWEYKSKPADNFFTLKRGSNQRLPNGNTLISESDQGRAFEVTAQGNIVWEFFNPETRTVKHSQTGDTVWQREAITRFTRITEETPLEDQVRQQIREFTRID